MTVVNERASILAAEIHATVGSDCAWCGRSLPSTGGSRYRHRPRFYCDDTCRMAAHQYVRYGRISPGWKRARELMAADAPLAEAAAALAEVSL